MNMTIKRSLSVLLALMICLSAASGLFTPTEAASYVYNWGKRGQVATELSTAASDFYSGSNTYENFSKMDGSSNRNDVPSSELYKALKSFMTSKHSHQTTYGETRDQYKYTDCENGGGKISSFYSGTPIGPNWGGNWNREHTWPNSKGLGGKDEDDIMMLRPTSINENSSRGNTAYGESSGYYDPNKESNGKYNLHGDVARIMLYTYVRWGNTGNMWGKGGVMESVEVLFKWMIEDPVDTWELGRNDAVQSITGTRNVFVDYPELAFFMFDRAIPANMSTPSQLGSNTSGSAGGSSGGNTGSTTPKPTTPAEIMAEAAKLEPGEGLDGSYTLSGTITQYEFVEKYGDANVTITVDGANGKTIYCYGLEGDVTKLKVGDHITVTGEIQNYKGTIEFHLPLLTAVNAGGGTTTPQPTTPKPTTPAPTTPAPTTPAPTTPAPTTPAPTTPEPSAPNDSNPGSSQSGPCQHDTLEKIPAVAATTDSDGRTEHYRCTACRRLFKDAEGQQPASLAELTVDRIRVDEKEDNTLVIVLIIVLVVALVTITVVVILILVKRKKTTPEATE